MIKFRKTASVVFLILLFLLLLVLIDTYQQKIIGGDKDEHGCLIAAGYSWNSTLQQCVRSWEIDFRNYTSKDVNLCPNLQIECDSGTEIFLDITGCGCQPLYAVQD